METHEQLELRVAQGLGDLMNGAAGLVGRPGVKAAFEGSADGVYIAVARGREDPFAGAPVDRGLELAPACEPVLAGDHQLGIGQPRRGIPSSHLPEALLGFVPEVFEIGAGGELA
jgi:hypothetical protein